MQVDTTAQYEFCHGESSSATFNAGNELLNFNFELLSEFCDNTTRVAQVNIIAQNNICHGESSSQIFSAG
jgi:hypothetical protein